MFMFGCVFQLFLVFATNCDHLLFVLRMFWIVVGVCVAFSWFFFGFHVFVAVLALVS